jgi:hypothetical protein
MLAVGQRVVAAHDALQLGELADHVGHEVGLGQHAAAAACCASVGAELGGDRRGQRLDALDALALGAELVVIDHRRQAAACDRFERLLAVLVEEELARRPGAGAPRARCRRRCSDGSATCMLLTIRKRLVSLPARRSSGKYFWLAAW